MKSKVAVTGYTGFVGARLCDNLISEDLICIGRKEPGFDCNFVYSDFETLNELSQHLKDVEVVIHCAARVHIMNNNESQDSEMLQFRRVNTDFTLHFAREASLAGVKRFVYISSIKVNGEETAGNSSFHADGPLSAIDPYGISKAQAELGLFEIGRETGMEIVVIRPPLVYGEGVKANFASLASIVNKGFPLPFAALTSNKRSLVSVYNLVDLIQVCMRHPSAVGNVFLVSDDDDLSTLGLVASMADALHKKLRVFYVPIFVFNILGKLIGKQEQVTRLTGSLKVDITKTKTLLGWTPPYNIEQGFAKALKGHNDAKNS